MQIYLFDSLPSTQKWLIEKISSHEVSAPCAVIANLQTDGIGSRDNRWIGKRGNFFASFALNMSDLPSDLPLSAASIYFAYLMKMTLEQMGSDVWIKWPNDLYIKSDKIGGCITVKKRNTLIAGIGVNIVHAPNGYGVLDIKPNTMALLKQYMSRLQSILSWKQTFSNFRLEFEKSKSYCSHDGKEEISLEDAVLQEDGSLIIGKRRVMSLR